MNSGVISIGSSELILLAMIGYAAFCIWMLIDCANNDSSNFKTAWILIILLAGCIGAPIYLVARKIPRDAAKARSEDPGKGDQEGPPATWPPA